jgi:hypothetical protein
MADTKEGAALLALVQENGAIRKYLQSRFQGEGEDAGGCRSGIASPDQMPEGALHPLYPLYPAEPLTRPSWSPIPKGGKKGKKKREERKKKEGRVHKGRDGREFMTT